MSHVKLHPRPGVKTLHIDDDVHELAADGTFTVPAHQVEAALSVGASHALIDAPVVTFDRLADLEARLASLELDVAAVRKAKK